MRDRIQLYGQSWSLWYDLELNCGFYIYIFFFGRSLNGLPTDSVNKSALLLDDLQSSRWHPKWPSPYKPLTALPKEDQMLSVLTISTVYSFGQTYSQTMAHRQLEWWAHSSVKVDFQGGLDLIPVGSSDMNGSLELFFQHPEQMLVVESRLELQHGMVDWVMIILINHYW